MSDWRPTFEALVASRMRTPFRWGVHDCCMWAADAVLALSGIDPAADLRGAYCDEAGARRLLESLGGLEAVGARGGQPQSPLLSIAGDVGIVTDGERHMLGVCAGHVWLVAARRGLAVLPLNAVSASWRVARA